MTALIDIHAFPGGSASGSYSGIYPNTPMFFKDAALQDQGYEIINNLCNYYDTLDESLRKSIVGVTLMNEPAHLIPEDGATMLAWLAKAVDIYRQRIVAVYASDHPLLFVNLIATCISDQGRYFCVSNHLIFSINTMS
jgi:aryl-phospho-beta-D-glucosidase BglC (GH1 family)